MGRRSRRLSTIPDEPVSSCLEQPGGTASSSWSVLVFDAQAGRLETVCRALSQMGANSQALVQRSCWLSQAAVTNCALAMVALESLPLEETLDTITALKNTGHKVVAYGDGLREWPIIFRCRALLAGATYLMDSATASFEMELRQRLAEARELVAERYIEERRIKETMMRLGIVGQSQPMIDLFRSIIRISILSDLPVLVSGETGTGKDCLARAIYQLDPKRRAGPFVALNCGALTPTLAESELFGHHRGAFTGADRERKGLIRAAHGGVLFLDEVGELAEALQAKLLRVLQENRVLAVGDEKEVTVDVRVVAATNRNLVEMVKAGRFRADLFHRLNVLAVRVPSLKERPADVVPLVDFFLAKHRLLRPTGTLTASEDFIEAIRQVDLSGNVRQLENIICQALAKKENDTRLSLSDLPMCIWQQLSGKGQSAEPASSAPPAGPPDITSTTSNYWAGLISETGGNLGRSLRFCERALLAVVLRSTDGNQTQAARLLGITPRSVYNKIRKYHLA